jgi:hypothetical protein
MAAQESTARESLLAFMGLAIALLVPIYGTGFYASQFREGELVASWRVGIFFSVLWGVLVFVFFRNRKVFLKTATRVFFTSGVAVALTTVSFPYVTGYGTSLFQLVVLGAWSLIAHLSSGLFADHHHGILYLVALLLNLVGFSFLAVPLWLCFRNRATRFGSFAIVGWTVFYVAMLFFLFPATDGP